MNRQKTLGELVRDGDTIDVPRHTIHPRLLRRKINIALVGVGGTGSEVLPLLARLSHMISRYEGSRYLSVDTFDPDVVSEFNIGRQLFGPASIGRNKALELTNQVNLTYGTRWSGYPTEFDNKLNYDIVISCVDTAAARRQIHKMLFDQSIREVPYWIDCGNLSHVGHVMVGQPRIRRNERKWPLSKAPDLSYAEWQSGAYRLHNPSSSVTGKAVKLLRLPCVTEVMTELMDPSLQESNEPSCSTVQATERQSPAVNRMASTIVYELLWELLRFGGLDSSGVYFDVKTFRNTPIPLRVWPVRQTAPK